MQMMMTVGDMTATVGPFRYVPELLSDVAHVTICDYRGVSVDVFDLYERDGVWRAWTLDTIFHNSIVLREQFAAQYNRRLAAR